MTMTTRLSALALAAALAVLPVGAASAQSALTAMGSPPNPKVPVSWDRYYDHAAIGDIGRRLQQAYPDRCRLGKPVCLPGIYYRALAQPAARIRLPP